MRSPIATYVVDFDGTVHTREGDLTKADFPEYENPDIIRSINRFTASALQTAQENGVYICICSGNIIGNILPKVTADGLRPDAISCKVGTELWARQDDGSYAPDAAHTAAMQSGFDNDTITKIIEAFFGKKNITISHHAENMNGQGKQSCHVALTGGQSFPDLTTLENQLRERGLNCKIGKSLITEQPEIDHFSAQGFDPKQVYNFDIVHSDAGKDAIAGAIFQTQGTHYNIVAGDGGNDVPLMLSSGVTHAIVVGNAAKDLRKAAEAIPCAQFSTLPAGLALVEKLLRAKHISYDDLPQDLLKAIPTPFQQQLYKAAYGLVWMLPDMQASMGD